MKRLAVLALSLTVLGCQTLKPTEVYQSSELDFRDFADSLKKPIVINKDTVVLDTRSPLDFGLNHVPGSHNVQWDAFRAAGSLSRGVLDSNLEKITRRLALLGVEKDSQVVVVGEGVNGLGQEARLAWMLLYVGVKDVQAADINQIQAPKTNIFGPPRENAPFWQPEPVQRLLASKEEVLKAARLKKPSRIHIIDARSSAEAMQKQTVRGNYVTPDLGAINIEWKEFFNSRGRPSLDMRRKLQDIGISPKDRIIVISNHGLRSAAVTYALTMIGFENVGNHSGGWVSLNLR